MTLAGSIAHTSSEAGCRALQLQLQAMLSPHEVTMACSRGPLAARAGVHPRLQTSLSSSVAAGTGRPQAQAQPALLIMQLLHHVCSLQQPAAIATIPRGNEGCQLQPQPSHGSSAACHCHGHDLGCREGTASSAAAARTQPQPSPGACCRAAAPMNTWGAGRAHPAAQPQPSHGSSAACRSHGHDLGCRGGHPQQRRRSRSAAQRSRSQGHQG